MSIIIGLIGLCWLAVLIEGARRWLAPPSLALATGSPSMRSREAPTPAERPAAAQSTWPLPPRLALHDPFGVVVLCDNDWDECTFDGERIGPASGSAARRGLAQVFPGVHRVETRCGDRTAVWTFTVLEGDVLVRRFDHEKADFVLEDPAKERQLRQLARSGALSVALVDAPRVNGRAGSIDAVSALELLIALAKRAAVSVETLDSMDAIRADARETVKGLIGQVVSPPVFAKMRGIVDVLASRFAMEGDYETALAVAEIGLLLLPEEPTLLDLAANLVSDSGKPQQALEINDRALSHAVALAAGGDAEDDRVALDDPRVAKAIVTRCEILAELGRRAEARELAAKLSERRGEQDVLATRARAVAA